MRSPVIPKHVGFLLKRSKFPCKTAHIWMGEDTACRMWSTGGLVKRKYEFSISAEGRSICKNCVGSLGYNPMHELMSTVAKHEHLSECPLY